MQESESRIDRGRRVSLIRYLRGALPSVLALLAALLVAALLMRIAGHDPVLAFSALIGGAFGSADGWSEVAVKACPLLLTGLAISVSFQTGLWNIGAEGQLLVGALAMAACAPWVSALPGFLAVPVCLVAAAGAGGIWAGIAGQLKLRRQVNEVISTIMLNFVALHLVSYMVQGPLRESAGQYPQTEALPAWMWLPRLAPPHRVHLGVALALVAAALVYLLLYRTRIGFEMRATGASIPAARLAGIPVDARFLAAVVLSGALAGLAGGVEVAAVTRRMYERFSPGWGFTAIAVGLLGRLSPLGVVAAAFCFGALDAGSGAMQRVAGVSSVMVSVIQATVIFFLLALERLRPSFLAPAAEKPVGSVVAAGS